MSLHNAVGHFRTITKHKMMVMENCFQVGLYRQGLLHDLSKYSWEEFRTGVRYYQGTRSPNAAERRFWDILPPGFTTREEISTTLNTGSTLRLIRPED